MYNLIKSFIKKIIPQSFIFKLEPAMRSIYSVFYTGNKYQCNICNKKLKSFIETSGSQLCPKCGSLSRDRRLWLLLENEFLKPGINILDFSPSRSIYRKLRQNSSINYTGTDLSGNFLADKNYDLTSIDAPENSFDLIICYHILEHIEDDRKAISELYRILKFNGECLIQTPFKDGDIFENPEITTDEGRLEHFGQEDHVRIYSVNGLKKRLEEAGFEVEIRKFEKDSNRYDFLEEEVVLVCWK